MSCVDAPSRTTRHPRPYRAVRQVEIKRPVELLSIDEQRQILILAQHASPRPAAARPSTAGRRYPSGEYATVGIPVLKNSPQIRIPLSLLDHLYLVVIISLNGYGAIFAQRVNMLQHLPAPKE
jgi:hypothetical protein